MKLKLHQTVIDRIVRIYDVWGGHREDTKLRAELSKVELMLYEQQSGAKILVDSDAYDKEVSQLKTY